MGVWRRLFYKIPILPRLYHLFWAELGAIVYRFPSRKVFVIGITGTKGKTTVVELLGFILEKAGYQTAALSSIGIKLSRLNLDNLTGNTMPGRFFIQRFLRKAADNDCQFALIEVTSEGVKLGRHRFIDWGAAVFLNLHPEHIEAHGGFEKYRKAKLDFFEYVKKIQKSVPSGHPPEGEKLKSQNYNLKSKTFFINKDDENADYFIKAAGGEKNVAFFGKSDLPSNLIGEFNQYNVGAAVAVARTLGISDDVIERAVAEFPGVPGRMEFVQKKPFAVVVDYAHTPESLRKVYRTLRGDSGNSKFEIRNSKLVCVLGSAGGGRDKWKRPETGKIAAEYCDEIILTDEDPYNEPPLSIVEEIERGARSNSKFEIRNSKLRKVIDRKEAIKTAIGLAKSGDIVVITGKGSERFIHIADGKKILWSDKQIVLDILREHI